MYIEDLINRIAGDGQYLFQAPIPVSSYDSQIIYSFASQINRGLGFTEKQSVLALKLVKKYKTSLSVAFQTDIEPFVSNPIFRLSKRTVDNVTKTIKIVSEANNRKRIAVHFPYDENLISQIKTFKDQLNKKWKMTGRGIGYANQISWNNEEKCWTFPLWEDSLEWIEINLLNVGFQIDEDLKNLIYEMNLIRQDIEKYVPMVVFEENSLKLKNCSSRIPEITGENIVEQLFKARNFGITTWDEKIEEFIEGDSVNPVSRHILKSTQSLEFSLDNEKYTLKDLSDIVKYHSLILVAIPGGSELENLKNSYNAFLDMGVPRENMSVLFRLDNQTGKDFNELIKMFKLNNPLDQNTKVIFVSGKIPKILITLNRKIDVVINLGDNSAHYTQKNLIKNHNFVINYKIRKNSACL